MDTWIRNRLRRLAQAGALGHRAETDEAQPLAVVPSGKTEKQQTVLAVGQRKGHFLKRSLEQRAPH